MLVCAQEKAASMIVAIISTTTHALISYHPKLTEVLMHSGLCYVVYVYYMDVDYIQLMFT